MRADFAQERNLFIKLHFLIIARCCALHHLLVTLICLLSWDSAIILNFDQGKSILQLASRQDSHVTAVLEQPWAYCFLHKVMLESFAFDK